MPQGSSIGEHTRRASTPFSARWRAAFLSGPRKYRAPHSSPAPCCACHTSECPLPQPTSKSRLPRMPSKVQLVLRHTVHAVFGQRRRAEPVIGRAVPIPFVFSLTASSITFASILSRAGRSLRTPYAFHKFPHRPDAAERDSFLPIRRDARLHAVGPGIEIAGPAEHIAHHAQARPVAARLKPQRLPDMARENPPAARAERKLKHDDLLRAPQPSSNIARPRYPL